PLRRGSGWHRSAPSGAPPPGGSSPPCSPPQAKVRVPMDCSRGFRVREGDYRRRVRAGGGLSHKPRCHRRERRPPGKSSLTRPAAYPSRPGRPPPPMLRPPTAGESHGPALTVVVEGLPAGVPVDRAAIDAELRRRQGGYGRGGRMKIESDAVEILS